LFNLFLILFFLLSFLFFFFRTIKDPKGKITINVWDKDEKSDPVTLKKFFKDETDDFLGTVISFFSFFSFFSFLIFFLSEKLSFDVEEIINRGYGPLENWFPLQKRSKRSNISGNFLPFFFLKKKNELMR